MKKSPTNVHYPEESVFMKEVNTESFWTFELGTREGINVPIWICIGFQRSDRQHDQKLTNDTSVRLPVISAECIIGNEKYPDNFLIY